MKKTLAIAIIASVFPVASVFAAAPVVSIDELLRQVTELQHQLDARNQIVADMQIQLTSVQEDARQLRGQLEDQDYKISQLLDRQRELYRDLDQRLSDLSSKGGTGSVSDVTTADVAKTDAPKVEPVAKVELPKEPVKTVPADASKVKPPIKVLAPVVSNDEQEQAAYDEIFPLVRNKQYPDAVRGYNQFLATFPKGKNAVNARYWLGQIAYVQNQLDEAETQYKLVISQFPDSSKTSEALLKLGEIARKRGNDAGAKVYLQKVIQQFPDSTSARQAQQKLQEIK